MMFWALFAAVAAIVSWPFVTEAFRPRITDRDRADAPGQIAKLPLGKTYFQWRGPKDGPVAVCVHGLTTPSFVWGPLADHLVTMGYRVLTYDLYGRGLSDRPSGAQDGAFFANQLDALLTHEGIDSKITLLGYSMGGAIASAFAAAYPGRVQTIALIAPAGLGHDLGPVADVAVRRRWFGTWLMLGFYPRSLRQGLEAERSLPSAIPNMVDMQIAESRKRGFAPAVLASLCGIMDEGFEQRHRKITAHNIPVLAIWGEQDDVIPLSGRDRLADWNPNAQSVVIAGAGHALAYTDVPQLAKALEPLRPKD